MRRLSMLGVLVLAAAMLLTFAPAALADDISGSYSGQWKCTPPDCDKPGGNMHGNLMPSGNKYGGTFTLENTKRGTLVGNVDATLLGNQFDGTISNDQGSINFQASVSGNTINGSFSGPLGDGTFSIHK